ncbi:MAG: metal ABC transporter solute-binding protein, Zn/Mn family [Gemmataceae bacterium]
MFRFRIAFRMTGLAIVATVLVLGSIGCGSKPELYEPRDPVSLSTTYSGSYPIRVVCTTGMVADLVRVVGGDRVEVAQLMNDESDPHIYKAKSGDISRLEEADLVFYNGLHLEGKLSDVLDNLSKRKLVFPVAEYYPKDKIMTEGEQGLDPHVWFDVRLWNDARAVVQEVLSQYDPDHAAEYKQRGTTYQKELEELHQETLDKLQTIPKERRVLITAHDAFRYFGAAYDIDVRGIQGISTESEASLKDVNDLVDFIVKKKIKAVFVENTVNERNMQSLIAGCENAGHKVENGGTLYSDAMGKSGSYVGMVRHNVDTIVKALK